MEIKILYIAAAFLGYTILWGILSFFMDIVFKDSDFVSTVCLIILGLYIIAAVILGICVWVG